MFNQILWNCLLFSISLTFSSCDKLVYDSQTESNFVNKESPLPILNITLNGKKDTLIVWGNPSFNLSFNNSNEFLSYSIFLDNTVLELNRLDRNPFKINTRNYSNGMHRLDVNLKVKIKNSSIGSILGELYYDSTITRHLFIDNSFPLQPLQITNSTNDNGLLKVEFQKYNSKNFQQYRIYKNGTLLLTRNSNDSTFFNDFDYTGSSADYRIDLVFADSIKTGAVKKVDFNWRPNISFLRNEDYTTLIKWTPSPFTKAIKYLKFLKSGYLYDEFSYVNDSTLLDKDTGFDGSYNYKICFFSTNDYFGFGYNDDPILIFSEQSPIISVNYKNLFGYDYVNIGWNERKQKIVLTKPRSVSFIDDNFNLIKQVDAFCSSVDGEFLFNIDYNWDDPANVKVSILNNITFNTDYSINILDQFVSSPIISGTYSYPFINPYSCVVSDSGILAFQRIYGTEGFNYFFNDIYLFDLKHKKKRIGFFKGVGGINSKTCSFTEDSKYFYMNSATIFQIESDTANYIVTNTIPLLMINNKTEFVVINGYKIEIYDSVSLSKKRSVPFLNTETDQYAFYCIDPVTEKVGVYFLNSRNFYIVDHNSGNILNKFRLDDGGYDFPNYFPKIVNNTVFVGNSFKKLN